MPSTLRPSACPGLLRIVQARDGGICRVKLAGGVISAVQASTVADAAQRYASSVIEATNRANLQIRGIADQQTALIESLLAAGLGPSNAAGDDVRNLMLSPSAGIDRQMVFDTRDLAGQILATLQGQRRFHDLSAKFAVQLDGGEHLAMLEHPHDLWLSAAEYEGERRLAFGWAGCPKDAPAGSVPLDQGHALVVAVLELFLQLAEPEHTRMRHLLSVIPAADLLARLAERVPIKPVTGWKRSSNPEPLHLGVHAQLQSGFAYVGAVPPLGRLDSAMLRGVARLSQDYGDATLRFSPWQSLLLPNIRLEHTDEVVRRVSALGFMCDASQAMSRLIACTGSTGCGKGLADTKGDALRLAALLQRHGNVLNVHLSGCSRSCAAAHVAPVTLLAVAPAHYDVYFGQVGQPGFGALQARNLTIEAVDALLDTRLRSPFDA